MSSLDLGCGLAQQVARGRETCVRGGYRVAGMRQLFAGNRTVAQQIAAPLQIGFRRAQGLLALLDLRPQFVFLVK